MLQYMPYIRRISAPTKIDYISYNKNKATVVYTISGAPNKVVDYSK